MIKVYKAVWVTEDDRKTSLLYGKLAFYGLNKNHTKKPLEYRPDDVIVPAKGMPPFIFAFEGLQEAERFVANEYLNRNIFYFRPNMKSEGATRRGKAIEIWECDADAYSHSLSGYGTLVEQPAWGTIFCANLVLRKLVKTYKQEVER